jgi:hypothetical protein
MRSIGRGGSAPGRIVAMSRSARRKDLALAMGANAFIAFGKSEIGEVSEALGGAPQVVFECVGAEGMLSKAIMHAAQFGRMVSLGFCTSPDPLIPAMGSYKCVSMQFAVGYSMKEFIYIADQMDKGHADPKAIITRDIPLTEPAGDDRGAARAERRDQGARCPERYALLTGFFRARKIQPNGFRWKTFRNEIFFAILNLAVGATILAYISKTLTAHGLITFNHRPTSWWVIGLEYAAYFLGFDTYFYWFHRLMHVEPIYTWVHKIHHRSTSPNVLTTLSVDPVGSPGSTAAFVPVFTALSHGAYLHDDVYRADQHHHGSVCAFGL